MASPHRPFFSAAAAVWLGAAGFWAWQLLPAAPHTELLLPANLLHGWSMGLGFMPLFIAGFALTTVPRWLGLAAPPAWPSFWPRAWLAVLGWALLLAGAALGERGMAVLGAALPALVLGNASLLIWAACRQPGARRSGHARGLALGLLVLALCQALAALALLAEQRLPLRLAIHAGLSLGVAGVFALALQRLTPFLHQDGRRQPLLLLALLSGLGLRAALGLAALLGYPPPMLLAWPAAAALLGLGLWLWRDAWAPELAAARRTPLVAQLHLGYLWLGLSFLLEAAALAAAASGRPGLLGLAPLHAMSLGFMCTTLLAMASRVSAVQQGRSVAVDRPLWAMQALLQATILIRLAADVGAQRGPLLALAGAVFALLALCWAGRYGPWLLNPPQPKESNR
ncbi:uncharacterized protein involved in response to NO [Paucibacter oligotrophus]|uniref:Uncharacterized protein involved in response to NO n=1 Tax=Roseateles oligotrophus TaxID=1769250 RepID=A0A840L7Q9_9BURK|nr:NnrS family protein [Roseateles oligotrophus]MBB4844230.1 uncharacterized protein involved in response to NO [Roseateles oligotrophus]